MADDTYRGCAACNRIMYVRDCDAQGRCPECAATSAGPAKKGAWTYLPEQDRKKAAAGDKDD